MENLIKKELQEKIAKMKNVYDAASTPAETKKIIKNALDNANKKLDELILAEKDASKSEEQQKVAIKEIAVAKAKAIIQAKKAKTPAAKKEIMHKVLSPAVAKARAAVEKTKTAKAKVVPAKKAAVKATKSLKNLVASKPGLAEMYAGTSESELIRDAARKAMKPGKRTSASGHTYYEKRHNRVDLTHSKTPYLEAGGQLPVYESGEYKVFKRTFEAKNNPAGSDERKKLNEDNITSEYMPSHKYAVKGHKVSSSTVGKQEAIDLADKFNKKFAEGGETNPNKKLYYQRDNIGKAKYTINFHDGVKTHKDGSAFYDIEIFKNKKDLNDFVKKLTAEGYQERGVFFAKGGKVDPKDDVTAEKALELMKEGWSIRVRGYDEDNKNFTGVGLEDYDGWDDEDIIETLNEYPQLQFWNEKYEKGGQLSTKKKAEKYVKYYLDDPFNSDMSVIFDCINMDMPTELEGEEYERIMDEARDEAIKHYTKHPEEMTDKFGDPFEFEAGGETTSTIWLRVNGEPEATTYDQFYADNTDEGVEPLSDEEFEFIKNLKPGETWEVGGAGGGEVVRLTGPDDTTGLEINKNNVERELLIDENRGIYIPQHFYNTFDFAMFGLKKEDYTDLSDPDNEFYWDAWDELLTEAVTAEGAILEQEGDLWLVPADYNSDVEFKKGGTLSGYELKEYENDNQYLVTNGIFTEKPVITLINEYGFTYSSGSGDKERWYNIAVNGAEWTGSKVEYSERRKDYYVTLYDKSYKVDNKLKKMYDSLADLKKDVAAALVGESYSGFGTKEDMSVSIPASKFEDGGNIPEEKSGGPLNSLTYKDGSPVRFGIRGENGKYEIYSKETGLTTSSSVTYMYADKNNKFSTPEEAYQVLRKVLIGLHEEIPQHNPAPSFYKKPNVIRKFGSLFFEQGGTLSGLKRKLQLGQGVKLVNYFGQTDANDPNDKSRGRLGKTRFVVKVQTNGVYFSPNKADKTGSYWEFPVASLVDVTDKGFTVYAPGERDLNEAEKNIKANAPKDDEQDRLDMMGDGSTMYYRRKSYYEKSGYGYLYNNQWEKGLRYDSNREKIFDKSIKGAIELAYEFVDDGSFEKGGNVKGPKISYQKSWGPDGTVYKQTIKIDNATFEKLKNAVDSERASLFPRKNEYVNETGFEIYLKPLIKINNTCYLNHTQRRFVNLILKMDIKQDRNTKLVIVDKYEDGGDLPPVTVIGKGEKDMGPELSDQQITSMAKQYKSPYNGTVLGFVSTWNEGGGQYEGRPVVYFTYLDDFSPGGSYFKIAGGVVLPNGEIYMPSDAWEGIFEKEVDALRTAKKIAEDETYGADFYEKGGSVSDSRVQDILGGYITAALWSTIDPDTSEPFDAAYSRSDIAPATLKAMENDVRTFLTENEKLINSTDLPDVNIGHDLWLTRNGHGSGFWDRDIDKDIADQLTAAAKAMKEIDLEVGDDGKIHYFPEPKFETGGEVDSEDDGFKFRIKGKLKDWDQGNKHYNSQGGELGDLIDLDIYPDGSFDTIFKSYSIAFEGELNEKLKDEIDYAMQLFRFDDTQYSLDGPLEITKHYAKGGKVNAGISRDRKFRSQEPHEQRYQRKTTPKNPHYMAQGGSTKKLNWVLGNDKAGKKYYYGFNNGKFYATEESNITTPGLQIKDIGLVFMIDKDHFMDDSTRQEFIKEMKGLFPELDRVDIIQAVHYEKGGKVDNTFNYMMLSRLQSDCDYFLGYGNRSIRHLPRGSVDEQIKEMKRLWNNLPEKPEWLSMEEIEDYEKKMKNPFSVENDDGVWRILKLDRNGDPQYLRDSVTKHWVGVDNSFKNEKEAKEISDKMNRSYEKKQQSGEEIPTFEKGGNVNAGISRDRKFRSQEPHEQRYQRKTSPKNPQYRESGGQIKTKEEFYKAACVYLKKYYYLDPIEMDMTDDSHPKADEAFEAGETPQEFVDAYAERYDLEKFSDGPYGFAKGGKIGKELLGATQNGEPKPSGYFLERFENRKKEAIVRDETGNLERYGKSPNFAGYHLIIDGVDYEFIDSVKESGGKTVSKAVSKARAALNKKKK